MKRTIDIVALIFVIIGAVNWGLVGIFQFDVFSFLFSSSVVMASRIAYVIIAVAGLWCISLIVSPTKKKVPLQ